MQDDLFRPTIHQEPGTGRAPWRPDSIYYPAFFGGPLAAATLGLINGRRLRLGTGPMLAVAAAGVLCFGGRLALSAAVGGSSSLRLAGSVFGVLTALVVATVERRPYRAFTYRGGKPASLIGPGLAAVIGCGLVEAFVIFGLVR